MKENSIYNILLLEDDQLLAECQTEILRKDNYNVIVASNIEEFEKKINLHNYIMIISDICLPDGNGLDVVKKLRESNNLTPVIFQSGSLDESIRKQAFELGALSVIKKPFTTKQVNDLINNFELYSLFNERNKPAKSLVLEILKAS